MRPSLNILSDDLATRIVDEAFRVLAEVGMEIRGPEMRRRLLEHGLPLDPTGERVLFPREEVERAIAAAPSSFTLYDRDGAPHADLGGDRVHFVPGSSGLKVLDHRTGETRLADTTDFVEYVRLADGLPNIAYLATAFSTNADIEAQVSDAWRLYLCLTNSRKPVVTGAFTEHGVPRMVEMLQMFRAGSGRSHRPPDGHLHGDRDRQLPVRRGLLPEPHRLRRGGGAGGDRAGDPDGPDRPGDPRRGDRLPHRRRAGRADHGPDRPARGADPLRRGPGHLPHEGGQLADGGDRGAPPRRGLRGDRQEARPALPVVHGPLRRQVARRPGRGRDVRQRPARRAGRGELRVGSGDARLRPRLQPGQARLRRRDVRAGPPLRPGDATARRPAGDRPGRTS